MSAAGSVVRARPASATRWRGYAFGIDVEAPVPIPGVIPSRNLGADGATSLELLSAEALEQLWRPHEAESIVDRRFADGRLMMSVERHDELGYRIWAPRHGRHIVSRDGLRIRSALPRVPAWRWQRLMFAQVLPLTATLRGLQLLHASAVALNGRVLGFVAPSGVGKTSVAAHLVAGGATLVTDDVMGLEPTAGGILAHPGTAMASIGDTEWQALGPEGRRRLGSVTGRSDKIHLAARVVEQPLPLDRIYFLSRAPSIERLRVDEHIPPEPRLLLSSGFISYLDTPERLLHHLEACARLAESVRTFAVLVPLSARAGDVARAVEAHAARDL